MEISIQTSGKSHQALAVSDKVFGQAFNEPLVHQIVTAYLSEGRQGTKAQKTRAEVSGSTKKPWKQKGTGRARAGRIRSPLWRTGGVTFAAKPRDYSVKVNKKMYRLAMCSIYSELLRDGRLLVVDDFKLDSRKTKDAIKKFETLDLDYNSKPNALLLIVADSAIDENLYFATRNIHTMALIEVAEIDPVSLLRYHHVVMTKTAAMELNGQMNEKLEGLTNE